MLDLGTEKLKLVLTLNLRTQSTSSRYCLLRHRPPIY